MATAGIFCSKKVFCGMGVQHSCIRELAEPDGIGYRAAICLVLDIDPSPRRPE